MSSGKSGGMARSEIEAMGAGCPAARSSNAAAAPALPTLAPPRRAPTSQRHRVARCRSGSVPARHRVRPARTADGPRPRGPRRPSPRRPSRSDPQCPRRMSPIIHCGAPPNSRRCAAVLPSRPMSTDAFGVYRDDIYTEPDSSSSPRARTPAPSRTRWRPCGSTSPTTPPKPTRSCANGSFRRPIGPRTCSESGSRSNPRRSSPEKLRACRDARVQQVLIWPVTDEEPQLERFQEQVVPLVAG